MDQVSQQAEEDARSRWRFASGSDAVPVVICGAPDAAKHIERLGALQSVGHIPSGMPDSGGSAFLAHGFEDRTIDMSRTASHPDFLALAFGQIRPQVAILVVDADQGFTSHDRRDCVLLSILGVRQLVFVIDKMDTVDFDERAYSAIVDTCSQFAKPLSFSTVSCLPLSFPHDENLVQATDKMAWYRGPTLSAAIIGLQSKSESLIDQPLRLPVQVAELPDGQGFTYRGNVVSGRLRVGDVVRIQPCGRSSQVMALRVANDDVQEAVEGEAVALTLRDSAEPTGAYVLSGVDSAIGVADQFEVYLIWTGGEPLFPGRAYRMRLAGQEAAVTVTSIKYKLNLNTLEQLAATRLDAGQIAVLTLSLDRFVAFDAYTDNKMTGSMIFFDGQTQAVVAVGMIRFALRRSHNIHLQHLEIDKRSRAQQKRQRPCIIWLTGLSGAGKSTIANLVEKRLFQMGRHTYLLDGDNVRHGLNRDLGFTEADRVENIRRVAEVAKLMVDAGLIVITAFISPFRAERAMARSLMAEGEFIEVFVDTPIAIAEERDPKGLYKKARRGELKNFTGIDSPYEAPEAPEIRLSTTELSAEVAADRIVDYLRATNPMSQA